MLYLNIEGLGRLMVAKRKSLGLNVEEWARRLGWPVEDLIALEKGLSHRGLTANLGRSSFDYNVQFDLHCVPGEAVREDEQTSLAPRELWDEDFLANRWDEICEHMADAVCDHASYVG